MSEETIKELCKGKNWKELLQEVFKSKDDEVRSYWNEAMQAYDEDLKVQKEEMNKELESIDRLFDTDLLRYIAKVLCKIKYKL